MRRAKSEVGTVTERVREREKERERENILGIEQ